ncbi:hypothetical protein AN958_12349 [Leucoagaricus sp. SymC.cos]|nr:hypothetical protein AN958_12349 [Leucoagaricus sp. SymC.cos]
MPVPHKGKGKKKCSSVTAELMPPLPHLALSASRPATPSLPASVLSLEALVFYSHPFSESEFWSHVQASVSFTHSPSATLSGEILDMVSSINHALASWSGKIWMEEHDCMHLAHTLSVTAGHIISAQWHTMPFKDLPGMPTFASMLNRLLPHGPT